MQNHAEGVYGIARVRADGIHRRWDGIRRRRYGIDTECRMESAQRAGWNQADEGVCFAECHTTPKAPDSIHANA